MEHSITFTRNWGITIVALALAISAAVAARPAQAEHRPRHWRAHHQHRDYRHERRYRGGDYYAPPPVFYPPPLPPGLNFIFPFRFR